MKKGQKSVYYNVVGEELAMDPAPDTNKKSREKSVPEESVEELSQGGGGGDGAHDGSGPGPPRRDPPVV